MQFQIPDYETILEIHKIVIENFGGLSGIPHPEYIESSLVRPQNYMAYDNHCDIHLVAALILDGIAKNHAFADGNKRTALIAMLMTYNLNNVNQLKYGLHMNVKFEKIVLYVTEKKPPIKQLRTKLKKLIEEFSIQPE